MEITAAKQRVLDALVDHLGRPGAVTPGFHLLGVVDRSDAPAAPAGITVVFRWHDEPTTYGVALPVTVDDDGLLTQLEGPDGWPGYPVASAEQLADEASFLLVEELDTGLVHRARRDRGPVGEHPDVVHLLEDGPATTPTGFFVGSVYLGEHSSEGSQLADVGLDTTAALLAHEEGRLVVWLQAYVNDSLGEPYVGHAAVAWEPGSPPGPGGTTRLVTLEVGAGWPVSLAQALLFSALRGAATEGAASAVVGAEVAAAWPDVLGEAGFTSAGTGPDLVLALADQRWPAVSV